MSGWIAKNDFLTYAEMENNATIIFRYLQQRGWSINAIAALLGNMEVESTINPQIWESLEYGNMGGGFGLVQWTPATKYIEWAGADYATNHYKQLERIIWEMNNYEQYYPTSSYPETFKEFSTSAKSVRYLAAAFLYNYERPADPDPNDRGNRAERWLSFLEQISGTVTTLPAWLLFKLKEGIL